MTVSVPIAVDADPDAVEKLLEDELGRAVAQLADLQSGKPVVRLVDITDAGQLWHCSFDVKDVGAQKQAGHEVRKRLLTRLHRERIALAVKEKVFLLPEKNAPQA
jgi:small-conductance mechanosensitive channel